MNPVATIALPQLHSISINSVKMSFLVLRSAHENKNEISLLIELWSIICVIAFFQVLGYITMLPNNPFCSN